MLWDLEPKPTRTTGPALSRDRIVRAAVELVDEQGMDALSMARLAERLGRATMSLYRHVASKDELQAVMLDAALGEPPRPNDPTAGWRAGLETWARALLAVYRRHPWMPRMEITGPPLSPGQLGWLEAGLVLLRDTALEPIERMSVMLLVSGYVRNEASIAIVGDEVRRDAGPDSARGDRRAGGAAARSAALPGAGRDGGVRRVHGGAVRLRPLHVRAAADHGLDRGQGESSDDWPLDTGESPNQGGLRALDIRCLPA
ncbi:TetR/AcrR family transcriptional regulator [Kutzneria kofuensis]|uniref:TetR/AcrR family transcriptional regulator n=1 Tax=Kutzneria kofuensis TaxID=103725 RepID=UPI0031E4EA9E